MSDMLRTIIMFDRAMLMCVQLLVEMTIIIVHYYHLSNENFETPCLNNASYAKMISRFISLENQQVSMGKTLTSIMRQVELTISNQEYAQAANLRSLANELSVRHLAVKSPA